MNSRQRKFTSRVVLGEHSSRMIERCISTGVYERVEDLVGDPVMAAVDDVFRRWLPDELRRRYEY